MAIAEGAYDEIDLTVRAFQKATMAVKYARVPVVAAPHDMALGGGCEVCLHADAMNAYAETYMGLVEIGVGLLPAGGGTKELACAPSDWPRQCETDVSPFIFKNFSHHRHGQGVDLGRRAARHGLLRQGDTHHHGRRPADPRRQAEGPGPGRQLPPVTAGPGPPGAGPQHRRQPRDPALEHAHGRLHHRVRGAARDAPSPASSPAATCRPGRWSPSSGSCDLEREAFLKLCGKKKTLERIQHMLKKGKPLRN